MSRLLPGLFHRGAAPWRGGTRALAAMLVLAMAVGPLGAVLHALGHVGVPVAAVAHAGAHHGETGSAGHACADCLGYAPFAAFSASAPVVFDVPHHALPALFATTRARLFGAVTLAYRARAPPASLPAA